MVKPLTEGHLWHWRDSNFIILEIVGTHFLILCNLLLRFITVNSNMQRRTYQVAS
jgi:hypothetical protein